MTFRSSAFNTVFPIFILVCWSKHFSSHQFGHTYFTLTLFFFPITNVFIINHSLQFHQIGDFPSPLQGQEVAHPWDYSSSVFKSFSIFFLSSWAWTPFVLFCSLCSSPGTIQHTFPWVLLSLYRLHLDNITFPRSSLTRSVTDPLFIFRAQCCEPRRRFNSQCCEPDVLLRRKNWVFESSS